MTDVGLGDHIDNITMEMRMEIVLYGVIAGSVFLNIAVTWSKSSFAISLLRISTDKWVRHVLWFILGSLHVIMVFNLAFSWLQCIPFAKVLNDDIEGVCYREQYGWAMFGFGCKLAMDDTLAGVTPYKYGC